MTDDFCNELEKTAQTEGSLAVIERLISNLRASRSYDRLFDAMMLRRKFEMGLPLVRPTSFDDVAEESQDEFRESYIDAAREVGQLLLEDNDIPRAWIYFRTIGEPEPVRAALDRFELSDAPDEQSEQTEKVVQVALYEGASPARGLEIMLQTHGTCNTITAMDQHLPQMSAADRKRAAEVLINTLYDDLLRSLQMDVQQREGAVPSESGIHEVITGRDFLFEDGNYHIDVSHLASVVRFGRVLQPGNPHLDRVIELAEYGSRLSDQFQYSHEQPFEDFYPAHLHYYHVLTKRDVEGGLRYFCEKLDTETETSDRQLIAYVIVDLLSRIDRRTDAMAVAEKHLSDVEDPGSFSFAELCLQCDRMDVLQRTAQARDDFVAYAAALVQDSQSGAKPVGSGTVR